MFPEFVKVTPSGIRVNVQFPVEGKPFKVTLPVATVQVGWTSKPTIGSLWLGTALITTFAEAEELQVPLETVKVYVPGAKFVTV